VPSAVLSDGIDPIGIEEGPYSGKPNPHAWMSPSNAVIYVENIRKALVKLDPANAATYNANAKAYSAKFAALETTVRTELEKIPVERRWLVTSEGAVSLSRAKFRNERAVPVGGERRPAGHAAAGAESHRWRAEEQDSGRLQRKHGERQNQPDRSRAKPVRVMVACSTSTRSHPANGPAPTYLRLMEFNAKTIVKGFTGK
jgi:manganese/iron transport system substrate-binding protein